jgi:hypothetical protein
LPKHLEIKGFIYYEERFIWNGSDFEEDPKVGKEGQT